MRKNKGSISSFLSNQKFSIYYAIKSIKDLRKSELCKAGKHDWIYVPEKGYYDQDHYKCNHCQIEKGIRD